MCSHCLIRHEADPPPVPEHRTRAQTEGNPLGASTPPMQRRQEPTGTPGTPGAPVSVRVSTFNLTLTCMYTIHYVHVYIHTLYTLLVIL